MREIIFRAWYIWNTCQPSMLHWRTLKQYGMRDVFDKDKFILMQYTGLKDKNGKEIYEGDIVRYWNVPWNTAGLGADWKYTVVKYERCGFNLSEIDYEILGNIYENAEILAGK